MARVTFTPNLQRHVQCPPLDVSGGGVREVLDAAFSVHERARGYVLDEHGTGERPAFGSTTGSAWVSEDAGDSWTAVSHHLPPIHCVRFA